MYIMQVDMRASDRRVGQNEVGLIRIRFIIEIGYRFVGLVRMRFAGLLKMRFLSSLQEER